MKKSKVQNEIISENPGEISSLLEKKYTFFQDIIKKTTIHAQKCKFMDIIGISDVHKCINLLKTTYDHLEELYLHRETKNVLSGKTRIIMKQEFSAGRKIWHAHLYSYNYCCAEIFYRKIYAKT